MPEPLTSPRSEAADTLTTSRPLQQSSAMEPSLVYGSSTPTLVVPTGASNSSSSRDSSWLELEVCQKHLNEGYCPSGELCELAHTDKPSLSGEGTVTCCYDFLKDRCHREHCKYFHPRARIKDRLVTAGKQFGAMMSASGLHPAASPYQPTTAYQTLVPVGSGLTQYSLLPTTHMPGEKLLICYDYLAGQCSNHLCPFVHPEQYVRQNPDRTVTICRDFVRSTGCPREQCRFYHPPGVLPAAPDAIRPTGFYASPQGMYMPAFLPPGLQQSTSYYYSPTSPVMFFPSPGPSSFPPANNSQVFMPISYPPVFPLPSPLPVPSISVGSGNGELSSPCRSQTIMSHSTIQH